MRRSLLALLLLLQLVPFAGPAAAAPRAAATTTAPATPPPAVWPGLLEVEVAPTVPAVGQLVDGVLGSVGGVLGAAAAFPGATDEVLRRVLHVEVAPGAEARVAELLARLPEVVSASPIPVRVPAYQPNDPQRAQQWHLDRIGAPTGWNVTRGHRGARLGVIDTQFDTGHPDLRGVLFRRDGKPGVEALDRGCRKELPYSEHGTFVAGIAGATTDNRAGVASVGFSIGVVAVQAGAELSGTCVISSKWSQGLVQLADAGIRAVNLSFSSAKASASEAAAIRYATSKGTLVVAAAGNNGSTTPEYPAAHPLVLGVAATDQADRLWARSNRGDWVDVAAPGVGVLTTCPGGYCNVTGTSAAAPVVAGIATLLSAAQSDLAGLQLRARVIDAAAEITGRPLDPAIGYGRARLDRTMVQRSVRLYGGDRMATAQAVAREAAPRGSAQGVDRVVLVPGDAPGEKGWTVTLPAAGLLADGRTAMVMTSRDRLHPRAAAELDRLLMGGGTVLLPGSTSTGVSAAVEEQLRRAGHDVKRISGGDGAGTAAALADEVLRGSSAKAALIARGDTFADALSLAGPAAAHGYPLLFVGSDAVPAATCSWIKSATSVGTLHLAGGPQAISPAVEQELQACTKGLLGGRTLTITRDAGASRVETSVAIARRHFGTSAPAQVAVANGFSWPDAVTGGALAAAAGAPVLLTSGRGELEPAVRSYVASGRTRTAFVLGGPAVVTDATRASLEAVVG